MTVRAVFAIVNLGTHDIPPDAVLTVEAAVQDYEFSSICHHSLTSFCDKPIEDTSLPPLLPLILTGTFAT